MATLDVDITSATTVQSVQYKSLLACSIWGQIALTESMIACVVLAQRGLGSRASAFMLAFECSFDCENERTKKNGYQLA